MPDTPPDSFDVIVVGAGPGGIAAAVTAAEAGRAVALVDSAPFPGGQIWRNPGKRAGLPADARRWLDRLDAAPITKIPHASIVARTSPHELLAETPAGPRTLRWASLILATGARELYLPFPGWTLPRVVGAGGLQALVKSGLPIAGKRVVIAGTGPLLLAVADGLRAKGAIIPLILEQTTRRQLRNFALSLLRSPGKLLAGAALRARLLRSRYVTDAYPLRASDTANALRVDYRLGAAERSIDCDYLACGFHLIPSSELPLALGCAVLPSGHVRVDGRLRTSLPNVYAVGELTAIGGAEKAVVEGRMAAHMAAGDEPAAAKLDASRRAMFDFANRLDSAFALRPEVRRLATPDTLVCRCEDVPLDAVQRCFSARDAKLKTRCGMGPCQGRVCGAILHQLLGSESPNIRPPILPASIETLISAHRPGTD